MRDVKSPQYTGRKLSRRFTQRRSRLRPPRYFAGMRRQQLERLISTCPSAPSLQKECPEFRGRDKRQLTLHLDADTAEALTAEAQKRGLNLSRMTNDVLRRVLIDESGEKVANTIKARLDRLDKRDAARAHEQALQKEILLLFIRVWFEYAGAPPEDESEASSLAEERFQGFLEMLAGEAR